jgi:hypothetical protein
LSIASEGESQALRDISNDNEKPSTSRSNFTKKIELLKTSTIPSSSEADSIPATLWELSEGESQAVPAIDDCGYMPSNFRIKSKEKIKLLKAMSAGSSRRMIQMLTQILNLPPMMIKMKQLHQIKVSFLEKRNVKEDGHSQKRR